MLFFVLSKLSCKKDSAENCSKPGINVTDNGNGSVYVSLTLAYDFVEIEYGQNEFSLGSGSKTNNTSISGLNVGAYDFYVRGDCGVSE